jgi:hypothetical protein
MFSVLLIQGLGPPCAGELEVSSTMVLSFKNFVFSSFDGDVPGFIPLKPITRTDIMISRDEGNTRLLWVMANPESHYQPVAECPPSSANSSHQ